MKAKEFKELIKNIPDDTDILFECQRYNSGEIINFTPNSIDESDYTIILNEDIVFLQDILGDEYTKQFDDVDDDYSIENNNLLSQLADNNN